MMILKGYANIAFSRRYPSSVCVLNLNDKCKKKLAVGTCLTARGLHIELIIANMQEKCPRQISGKEQ